MQRFASFYFLLFGANSITKCRRCISFAPVETIVLRTVDCLTQNATSKQTCHEQLE